MVVFRVVLAQRILRTIAIVWIGIAAGLAGWACPASAQDIQCPSCQAWLSNDALFCSNCGKVLPSPESIFCWRCGTTLPADARYCSQCGSRICTGESAGVRGSTRPERRAPEVAAVPLAPATPATGGFAVAPAPAPAVPGPPPPATPVPAPAAPAAAPPETGPPLVATAPPGGATTGGTPATAEPQAKKRSLRRLSAERMLVFPPRVLVSPTGTILPSMVLHVSAGGSFGLSENSSSGGFLISFGLGGVGEAMVSSSRILHVSGSKTNALAGFRVKLPVSTLSPKLAEHLAMALNIAASDDNDYDASGAYATSDEVTVSGLYYTHRETTLGMSATWKLNRVRIHGAIHATDLRSKDIAYYRPEQEYQTLPNQRDTYTTLGLGVDYAVNDRTQLLAEVHSLPRIALRLNNGDLFVQELTEYMAGLRFYMIAPIGIDVTLAIDEEAVGLADLDIGFAFHLTLGPRNVVSAVPEEEGK
jgi:hypothetical protein